MYCYKCGKEVENDARFCPYCGTQLDTRTSMNGEYEPIHEEMHQTVVKEDDAPSGGFAFISFLIPIVGIVLYVIWHKEYPLKAKSCLKGIIAGFVLEVVMFCCVMSMAGGMVSQSDPNINWDVEFNHAVVETVPYE